jgi:hypothetical protein
MMTAKEYLSQLKRLEVMIDHELIEYTTLMERAKADSSPALKERVQTSQLMEPMDDVISAVDISKDIVARQKEYLQKRREIVDQIHSMSNPLYANVLYKRYVLDYKFERIATDINHTYRYTINIHGSALRAFQSQFLSGK